MSNILVDDLARHRRQRGVFFVGKIDGRHRGKYGTKLPVQPTKLPLPKNAKTAADMPALAVELHPGGAGWCVRARNLGPDLVSHLGKRVELLLRVRVAKSAPDDEDVPDIS